MGSHLFDCGLLYQEDKLYMRKVKRWKIYYHEIIKAIGLYK